jgi:hypothetical protein
VIFWKIAQSSLFLITYAAVSFAQFGSQIDSGKVEYNEIKEASGLASSKKNPGVLWTHNDTNDKNRIYAMSGNGKHLGTYYVQNTKDRDWEDIAVGPGPESQKSYIYVGNIGDNDLEYDVKYVYRCEEPDVTITQNGIVDTIENVDVLKYCYPDGRRNAETLMLDPLTKDYYIISKREEKELVYKAAFPQPLTTVDTLECVDTLDMTEVVAGDISADGREIIIKTYKKIYYWKRTASESIQAAMRRSPSTITYQEEPQGEGLTWDCNASGYFTLSEEENSDCHLYYYPRIVIGVKKFSNGYNNSRIDKEKKYLVTTDNAPVSYLLSGRKNVAGSKRTTRSMIRCAGRNY